MIILVTLALTCSTSVMTLSYSSNTFERWSLPHGITNMRICCYFLVYIGGRFLPIRLCLLLDVLCFLLSFCRGMIFALTFLAFAAAAVSFALFSSSVRCLYLVNCIGKQSQVICLLFPPIGLSLIFLGKHLFRLAF